MNTIAYYISDYGFGHATRSIAIIRNLFKLYNQPDLKVIICHSFAIDFFKDSLAGLDVEFREVDTDVGYILKPNSMNPDAKRLQDAYLSFVENWSEKLTVEKDFLAGRKIDLVLSDISPLPFIPASTLGIPSVGISNFTWYTAYTGLVDEHYLQTFKESYQHMDYFYSLAASQEPNWGRVNNHAFGFVSREVSNNEVKRILDKVDPYRKNRVIYFGLGMKVDIDLKSLELWNSENCVFLVSNNVQVDHPNVIKIPKGYTESQNYIAAADLVISKAGWGTVSEAILHHKSMMVLNRYVLNEDKNTIDYLTNYHYVTLFDWEDLMKLKLNGTFSHQHRYQSNVTNTIEVKRITEKLIELL
ncbi:glycosyltransferase [Paraliobacillus ryukyuensis]|uniref:glycosyltransferase n=1 Tax=Paraliobacillus ryukyuensis TaxID=200904 RepID=UPI0009A5F3A1|nr:glycosyltransferase [Paraliobacillus ryukyuensis]